MRLDCALLCDAVTVRDGLLHILGGGVGRVRRLQYPAVLENDLALRLCLAPDELRNAHTIDVRVLDADGATTSSVTGEFIMSVPAEHPAGREAYLNMPVSMRQVVIPAPGTYSVDILVDANPLQRLELEAAIATPAAPAA